MRKGDESAFDIFIRRYYEDILRYCTYHCLDEADAKDLAQNVFLHFFKSFDKYTHKGRAKNYLYTIAANLCKNYYKKKKDILLDSSKPFFVENDQEETIEKLALRMAVDRLSEEFREVIILYYYQDLKQHDISKILRIGLPLVKYRIKKAKEELKKILKMGEGYGG